MTYRGKIIKLARYFGCPPANYVCTAHYAGHVEVVPIEPGEEDAVYPPIAIQGALAGLVYDAWDDADLIAEVTARCQQCLQNVLHDRPRNDDSFAYYGRIHTNLSRLQSLDGDQPVEAESPVPEDNAHAAVDRVFEELGKNHPLAGVLDDLFNHAPVGVESLLIVELVPEEAVANRQLTGTPLDELFDITNQALGRLTRVEQTEPTA